MARPKNRKRRCADEAAQDNRSPKRLRADEADQGDHTTKRKRPHLDEPPRAAKKFKSTSDRNFVPRFWDNLSRVWLTQRALRELNRRNNACPLREITKPNICSKSLARFARHGGPDLCHLRGVSLSTLMPVRVLTNILSVPTADHRAKHELPRFLEPMDTVYKANKRFFKG